MSSRGGRPDPIRALRLLVSAAVIAIAVTPVLASPARACSCATPMDLTEWVDGSEAVFVGSLIEKRPAGNGAFAQESIYVFEVEEWVKGDAGDVIEVRSASDGAGCGFEFWDPDQRVGAAIHEENGQLHGGLCSQIDPDVLLAAVEGPTPSSTGIGHLVAAHGWSSTRLTILDEVGAYVADLSPPGEQVDWDGTQGLEACPGGDMMIQWTQTRVVVWDLATLDAVASHEVTAADGYPVIRDASCRAPDASSIWVVGAHEFEASLLEVVGGTSSLLTLSGDQFSIGIDFVMSQPHHEGDATWVDIETGDETRITETPPDELRSISVAPHPSERLVALVETVFNEGGPVAATLSIVDETGTRVDKFEIPWETYSPMWLDDDRVAVKAYNYDDWEQSFGFVFDLSTGEMIEIEGWDAEYTIADGDTLYGVNGGDIMTSDPTTRTIERLVTLPTQSAGPLVLLDDAPEVNVTTTPTTPVREPEPTTPPLVAPELPGASDSVDGYQWVAGGAIAIFLGLLFWLSRRPSDQDA